MASTPWSTRSRPPGPPRGRRARPAAASLRVGVLQPALLGPDIGRARAVTADALAQAGAPVPASARADAVVADLVAQALAQVRAGDPATGRPFAPEPLAVEAVAGERALAQMVPGRAADIRAVRAPPGRAAVTGRGGVCRDGARREHREPARAAHEYPAQRVPAAHLPGDPLGDRADPVIHARSWPSTDHVRSSPLP